ncbi:transposase family protein [Symbiopectobacterium purcellii]|uniref:transposase family protein n=1 Tax=Symbiopectobacterium purcellii TaxID=2871826 RepID=UPI003F83E191
MIQQSPLSPEQKQENKIISGIRITVEHAIAGIKRLGCMTALLNKSELADRMTPSATPVILS